MDETREKLTAGSVDFTKLMVPLRADDPFDFPPGPPRLTAAGQCAKHQILLRLAGLNIARCEVRYVWDGGTTYFHGCIGMDMDDEPVSVPADLIHMLHCFVKRFLPVSVEDQLGSRGKATFYEDADLVRFQELVQVMVEESNECEV